MAYIVPTRDETREDQRLYTQARMVPVECQQCGVQVRVKKNSEHHTSIQWPDGGPSQCPEFVRATEEGSREIYTPCPYLASSIEHAVKVGALTIGAEDGY